MKLVAPHRRTPPGEFPAGWKEWFASMHERVGAITGASPEAIAAVVAQRPLVPPPPSAPELTTWQAFIAQWRQDWHRPEPEDRHIRWIAGTIAVGWHVFLAAMLMWLMYLQYLFPAHPPRKGEQDVVQVEFIGAGTPEQVGGGAPTVPAAQAAPARPDQAARPPAPSETAAGNRQTDEASSADPTLEVVPIEVATLSPPPPAPAQAVAEPADAEPATPVAEQHVQVSEPVPEAAQEYVLPPPTPRLHAPQLAMPELSASAPTVEMVEVPNPQRPSVAIIPARPVEQPTLEQAVPAVTAREIAAPLPRLPTPSIARPVVTANERQPAAPAVRSRDIPSPPPAPPQETATAPAPAAEPPPAAAPSTAALRAEAAQPSPAGTQDNRNPVAAGAGPKAAPVPGGWASPARADDWGDSDRERPGAQRGQPPGLYDSDGSVRLAEPPGSASPGQPPGTPTDEIVNLDRAGTWLKRPPTDYEPTAFDRYWRPNESLLEEWVRKSISTVRIPIPGTNKHIVCQTVLLVVGGGCGISDPNLNEQPASARPPPDVPFKPELQDDNGSAAPPAG